MLKDMASIGRVFLSSSFLIAILIIFIVDVSEGKGWIKNKQVRGDTRGFFQISDVHLDPTYLDNGMKEGLCRVASTTPMEGGTFGRYGCDLPLSTLVSAVEQMYKIDPNPSFILFTGDSTAHNTDEQTHVTAFKSFYSVINSKFPNTPVIPTIGNNDLDPNYQFYCSDDQYQKQLEYLENSWPKWVPKGFQYAGAISSSPLKGLRIISINSIMYHFRANNSERDPCGQFKWLETELQSASQNKERVYIIGHIPPIYDSFSAQNLWLENYKDYFFRLLKKYSSLIIGSFWGHQHKDQQKILTFEDEDDNKAMFALLMGSLSPIYGNNPSFRYFSFNSNNMNVTNYSDYFMHLRRSNQENQPSWNLEYDFNGAYNQKEVSVKSVRNVMNMISDPMVYALWKERWQASYSSSMWTDFCSVQYSSKNQVVDCINQHEKYT